MGVAQLTHVHQGDSSDFQATQSSTSFHFPGHFNPPRTVLILNLASGASTPYPLLNFSALSSHPPLPTRGLRAILPTLKLPSPSVTRSNVTVSRQQSLLHFPTQAKYCFHLNGTQHRWLSEVAGERLV